MKSNRAWRGSSSGQAALRNSRENFWSVFGLFCLLVVGGLALFGPTGIFAWSESSQLLEKRRAELAAITEQRDALKNRVVLLNPQHADRDLVGELMRDELNVARPNELVVPLR